MISRVISNVVLLPALACAACGASSREAAPGPPAAAESPNSPAPESPLGPLPKGIEAGDLDRKVDPCTDFYEFANGTWRAQNPIPRGKPKWSRRGAAREANRGIVAALIAEVSAKTDWPAGSAEQIVGDHYAACMDEAAAERAGLTPVAPLLAEIDGIKTRADVQRVLRRLHELGIAAGFGETATYDLKEPMNYQWSFGAGSLGLGDRDAYTSRDAKQEELRGKYQLHLTKLLTLAGTPRNAASAAADLALAMEARLAEASLPGAVAADPAATTHKTSFAQLRELAPTIEWDKFFDEAKVPRQPVNVAEPKLLAQVDKEVRTAQLAAWKAYFKTQVLTAAAPWLSSTFAQEAFAFHGTIVDGASEPAPRAARCWQQTEALFGEPVGKLFTDRHFPPATRAKAQEIVRNLLAEMKAHVATLPWMSAEAKRIAITKIETMNVQVGHPDTWKPTTGLAISRTTLWSNLASARAYNAADLRSQVGRATNRSMWALPPSSAGAYIDPPLNQIVLPAGFLQPPYFDPAASDAVNYGALGAGLAHDMTHAFDATGAAFDLAGRPQSWWTAADQREFDKRAQCIVEQYDGYEVEPGVRHQGKLVLPEALGDQAGLTFALMALKKSMATRPVPTIDGFSPEQQFFLAWGQFRGEAMRLEVQRELVKSDTHPTPKFRVNGPMVNLPEFAQAFSCKPDAAMVRAPANRCAVW